MMAGLCLFLASLLSSISQLCQKQATRAVHAGHLARHRLLWLGLALAMLGSAMVLWLMVLQRLPVGIAYPMLSLNFVWVTLGARFIWHEPVSLRHWSGVGLIMAGIALLGSSL